MVFHCLNQCALSACASTASMFASNQTACQRKKTSPDENLCSSPVKPSTTPHTRLARALRSSLNLQVLLLPGASFSTVMVKQESVPIMANFEPIFLRSVNECGADFSWKYSQDTALQEIPAKFSSLLLSWSVARRSCRSNRVMTGLCDLASEKSMCANADVWEVRVLRVGKSTTVVLI